MADAQRAPATGALDTRQFRNVMGHFATGVTVVTYRHGDEMLGMTANAFMSVSLDPPLAALSVRRKARFATAVGLGDRFGVNFLAESQEALSKHFGGRPLAEPAPLFETLDATPLLAGSLAQLVLQVDAVHEAGDHLLYVARVQHLAFGVERRPLVFYSGAYQQVTVHETPRIFWAGDDGW